MTPVVYAVQTGDALRVYVRDGDAELRQVSQSTVHVDVDPARLVTLVADLDTELGWSGPVAAGGERVLVSPPAAAAVGGPHPHVRRKARPKPAEARTAPQASARRERIMSFALARTEPFAAADVIAAGVLPADLVRTGRVYHYLNDLVRMEMLVRSGEQGAYRWSAP